MATTTLHTAPPIQKSASSFINASHDLPRTSRADAPTLSIRSFACLCGPLSSSSHHTSFRGALFTVMPGSCMSPTGRALRSSVRAVHNSSNATATDTTEERIRVKEELLNLLEQSDGNITPEGMDLIGMLEKLNPNPDPSHAASARAMQSKAPVIRAIVRNA